MHDPIFKSIFGKKWNDLPTVMHKHYNNLPFSNDIEVAEGLMDIKFSKLFLLISPFLRFLKILIPLQGKNIFTRVTFASDKDSAALSFKREFFFDEKKPEKFFSKMIQISKNKVAEVMNYGICWVFFYDFENEIVTLKHHGYAMKLGRFIIPLPLTFLLGYGYAEEKAISDDEFQMKMTITHFLFGELYRYQGRFKMIK